MQCVVPDRVTEPLSLGVECAVAALEQQYSMPAASQLQRGDDPGWTRADDGNLCAQLGPGDDRRGLASHGNR